MLTAFFAVLSAMAVAASVVLFLRLRKQVAAQQQLAREHEEFKSRYQVVLDVEAEKARVLQTLEVERAGIQSQIAATMEEKQRVQDDLEAAKQDVRAQVEAEAKGRRAELEAERERLERIVAQIRVNQQEALQELHTQRQQGEADMTAFQAGIERLRAEFNALDEEANLQSSPSTSRGTTSPTPASTRSGLRKCASSRSR